MAKYSTGGSGGSSDSSACELCGKETDSLSEATIAGAALMVCPDCAPHDDGQSQSTEEQESDRRRQAAQNVASQTSEIWDGDSSHWETEGTDYDDDPLPYLVSEYGDRVTAARQDVGLTQEELADELAIDEQDLLAVEQGRAARGNVGGSVIESLEDYLEIDLVRST